MALKRRTPPKEKGGGVEYDKLENGEYEGRLVYVADLGLQERNYQGDKKPDCQQIALGIEIVGHPVTIDGEKKPRILWTKPFNVFHELTSLGTELAMYSVFNPTAREGEIADWDSVLGTPCNVVVGKKQSGDRLYDTIDALTAIPTKFRSQVPEAETEPCIGDADDPTNPCTMALYGLVKWKHEHRKSETRPNF